MTILGCLGISEFWTISDWTELGLVELSVSSFLSAVMSVALFSFFCMTCLWVLCAETTVICFAVL